MALLESRRMRSPDWIEPLLPHAARLIDQPLAALLEDDPARLQRDVLEVGPITACFRRQRIDAQAWQALYELAERCSMPQAIEAMFRGDAINASEQRPALHVALRSELEEGAAAAACAEVRAAEPRIRALAESLRSSGVTDVVHVGIGGSDLGPRLLAAALGTQQPAFRMHFMSSPDGHALQQLIARLQPERTAVVLVSKSFSTEETRLNGRLLLDWLQAPERVYAISANVPAAEQFGVPAAHVMPMWDWVGGRYSLWSAVGFSVRAAFGETAFAELLRGAAEMDRHFRLAPVHDNLPIRHALVAIWNRNAMGYASQAVLPYDLRLGLLPDYLQQLVMESLGKSALADGSGTAAFATVPVVWGGPGTDCQHSYFQALHQATETMPCEFIGVIRPDHPHAAMHLSLWSNLLAQGEALALGSASADLHRHYPGSRPSSVFMLDQLDAHALGALLAMYEHSVYAQSVVWGINAFDQWGVELGKKTAHRLAPALRGEQIAADPISADLVHRWRARAGD